MATVRGLRIQAAMKAIEEQIGFGRLTPTEKANATLRRRAEIELVAEAVVDVLFPDHLLDNIEVPD